ncbi:WD repeat-containing protein C10orf79 [Harpegnathos saltator]|uniref:Cilia- and flagella-associated protein 43 n=1 Tax=Harpegnathos saltator TaxID=610380 RepID=E2C509_HARSA|nr:WD repeat-containing protein C10orf79 [Harpegnathos saltator]
MDRITKTPCWVRGSKIEEIVCIGKDVLAWCTGLYIVFFHVLKRQQTLRWCWNQVTGDGAHRISSHVSSSIFAFSERSMNPRIFVLAYPAMTKICECVQGCVSGYLAIAFTAHDYLVSLGSYPDFPLIVWCWRTGEKIIVVDTSIRDEVGQTIKVTPTSRTVIAQVAKTCGKLFTWELDIVGKLVVLKDHEVKLPDDATIHGVDWCPVQGEPLLAIVDIDGHIYLSSYDGIGIRRIVTSQRCGICLNIELPAICWFHGGIILRTTFCQIRYFQRDPQTDFWRKQWYIKSITKPYLLVVHPFKDDWLFYYTLEGYLMQIIFPEVKGAAPNIQRHLYNGGRYRFVDFVRPWCHHLVVTDDLKELSILESYNGSELSKVDLDMEGVISDQAAHPDDPLIVVISDQGEMVILGVTDPEQPTILARFRLQKKPLDFVRFSQSGEFLIAAQKERGNCYCVNLRRDKPWSVTGQLRLNRRITDVALYDDADDGNLKLLALCVTYLQSSAGHQLRVYDVPRRDTCRLIDTFAYTIVTLPRLFRELRYAPGSQQPRLLIGSPYLSRRLQAVRLRELKSATLTDTALTGHHVRFARVFSDRHWLATCAYDGLAVIRGKVREIVAVVPAHHRLDSGSVKVIVTPAADKVVVLGHDGSLVATCVHRADKILDDYGGLEPAIRTSLTRARQDFPPKNGDSEDAETWEEWRQGAQVREEASLYAAEKAAIVKDLMALKDTVRRLLDENETRPEIERLPVSAFDVDRVGRDQKSKAAKDEREDVRMELEHVQTSADRVALWIKKTFWEPQVVQGRSIFSFRGNVELTNYPLLAEQPYLKEHLRWAQFSRESMRNIVDGDTFQPWRVYTDEQLQAELRKPVRVQREHDKYKVDVLFEEEEGGEEEEEGDKIVHEELTEQPAFDGMTTSRFVEQSPHYYAQIESYGFAQATLDDCHLMDDCCKLRNYFNRLFDDVYAAKEQEMSMIKERNQRIRHIDSELKTMFGQSLPHVPSDPQWHPKEKVESIIQVHEHEVKAKLYVSPSLQAVLKKHAEEAVRARQLLLADDFREGALMRMMDGVLEVRWEDIIKVDVREPACMLEKQPEQYTPADIAAVQKYQADVEVLRQERERYRRILEADYAKIIAQLRDGIDRFDARLEELFQRKLQVDTAINQLKLRHLRGRARNLARVEALREDERVKREIAEARRQRVALEEDARNLQHAYQDLQTQQDALCARDKTMARILPQDFPSLSIFNVELLDSQYKRRPRVTALKNVAANDLVSLGRYLTSHIKPAFLPAECADFARVLESLDARPGTLPKSIHASHWERLVQARRRKIELELQIRARQLEVSGAERIIAKVDAKIACRSRVENLSDELKRLRDERLTREQDIELQLVLKRGQVEAELRGERHDTADAVMVPRLELERVNEHILAAGSRKLNALKRHIDLRHGTLSAEWEHRCLRTRFRELEEDLHFLRDVTLTKDMQAYLKRVTKGWRDDKVPARLQREVDSATKALERTLADEAGKLEKIRGKIASVKKKNAELDRRITEMSVARWKMEHERDPTAEAKQREHANRKMRLYRRRSELVRKIQENYAELLALQTEHELLRMRTRPMLEFFEMLDDEKPKCD